MENLKPILTINDKDYEIKKTRSLMVEFQRVSNENKVDEDVASKYLEIQSNFEDIEKQITVLGLKCDEALSDLANDPTNADKKAKYDALKKLVKEAQKPLLDGKSEEMQYMNKLTKIMLDNYEKCIIFALSEQYDMSRKSAEELWTSFVDEVGVKEASQWIYAIGDTLFNQEAQEDNFLTRKRARQQQMLEARKKIQKK